MLMFIIYAIIAVLLVFIAAGAVIVASSLIRPHVRTAAPPAHSTSRDLVPPEMPPGVPSGRETTNGGRNDPPGVRGTLHRYVGPVEPRHALLTAPVRVAVEFVAALFGFPGLGWLISGKVMTGLFLLVVGPSIFWGVLPAYLVVTERIVGNPYLTVQYLPVLAVVSATALGVYQLRLSRGDQGRRLEAEG